MRLAPWRQAQIPVNAMNSRRNRETKLLGTTVAALRIVGCCALLYCIFSVGDALFTQARLAHRFDRTRSTGVTAATRPITTEPIASDIATSFVAAPKARAAIGRLDIPRIGLSAMVLEGVGSRTLSVAVGHFPGTSNPGQPGNVAVAGHRDTFFRPLRQIAPGDEIAFETSAQDYHYRVSSVEIVDPSDIGVLKSHESDELTLITCYPFSYIGRAPKRFIVHAVLAN